MAGGSLFGRVSDRSSSIGGDPGESRLMVRARKAIVIGRPTIDAERLVDQIFLYNSDDSGSVCERQ